MIKQEPYYGICTECGESEGIKRIARKRDMLCQYHLNVYYQARSEERRLQKGISRKPLVRKQKKPIAPRSKKRAKQERIYRAKRAVFLSKPENRYCQVKGDENCTKIATQVHHAKGRAEELLIDERYFVASCHYCNTVWIENNPIEAREKGFTINRST